MTAIPERIEMIVELIQNANENVLKVSVIRRRAQELSTRFERCKASSRKVARCVKMLNHLSTNDDVEGFLAQTFKDILISRQFLKPRVRIGQTR